MKGPYVCRTGVVGRITGITWSVMVALALCACQPAEPVPDSVTGYWTTSAPGYGDKYLKITKSSVIFGTGPSSGNAQPIREVTREEDGARTLYTVVYGANRGEEQVLSFYHDPEEGTITFRNQPHLRWKKTRES